MGLLLLVYFTYINPAISSANNSNPDIVSLFPEAGSSDVNFDGKLIVRFDRDIRLNSGFFIIKNLSDDSIISQIDVKSILVKASRNTVTITPLEDLSQFEDVYVEITQEAIMDNSGNYFSGITTSYWNFSRLHSSIQDVQAGVLIDATTRASFVDDTFIRFEYYLTRSDNNDRVVCRADYSGIKVKPQRYLFPIGSKEIISRFRLYKKQIKKLRKQGERHTVTIDISCTDGSNDSHNVILTL